MRGYFSPRLGVATTCNCRIIALFRINFYPLPKVTIQISGYFLAGFHLATCKPFSQISHRLLYRKALIFRGPYISRISRISLRSRNLFSTKIASTSRDPYTSVIRTSSTQIALCKHFESSFLGLYASGDFFSYLRSVGLGSTRHRTEQ